MAQLLRREHIADVRNETRQRLLQSACLNSLKPDAQIAIIAGSRGMGGFVELLAGVVDAVKAKGGRPFLIPAMGSHGGATEERVKLKYCGDSESLKKRSGRPLQLLPQRISDRHYAHVLYRPG